MNFPMVNKSATRRKLHRRFNLTLLGTALSPVLAVGLFNYIIDPYGIYKTPTLQGLNVLKPAQDDQTRLFKSVDIIQFKPQRIILGSSRAILGLDPAHKAFHDRLQTYNLGLTGTNMAEVREYFHHSLVNQPHIKQVVLAIDFFMFKQQADGEYIVDNNILDKTGIPPLELVRLTLSLDTLKSSQRTLDDNLKWNLNTPYYFQGMRKPINLPGKNDKIQAFKYQINNYFNTFYKDYQLSPQSLEELKSLVRSCREKNIDLKVLISPVHATQMETIDRAGLWKQFEDWKRQVSKITPFWDFATYNPVTVEPIDNKMQNFTDSAHYTPRVGDWVLDRVFADESSTISGNFGELVNSQNIESHLDKSRASKKVWQASHPEEVKIVDEIYQKIKK